MQPPKHIQQIKRLIWVYFFLLVFEGALRKWVLPSLSSVLLIIRDPVVLSIYFVAFRNGIFPRNAFLLSSGVLALFMLTFGLFGELASFPVALYGLRTDFLHLPLIFIMARVWTNQDVKQLGRWVLILALPLTLLMALQFRAAPTSWLNAGAGGNENGQIASAAGHVRASATFSFISGPIFYFALASVFLFYAQMTRRQYQQSLIVASTLAVLIAAAVSGSRSFVVGIGIVTFCALICSTLIQPFLMFRWFGAGAVVGVLVFAAQNLSVAQEGAAVFTQRVSNASSTEGGSGGFLKRALNDYNVGQVINDAPFFGYGLGSGTNAGATMITGKTQFLVAEGEWGRVIQESGPILGTLFLVWRVSMTLWLGAVALKRAFCGNTLPFLLFGACALQMMVGQWGQATTQGFTVFVAGLCLASMRVPQVKRPHDASVNFKDISNQRSIPVASAGVSTPA